MYLVKYADDAEREIVGIIDYWSEFSLDYAVRVVAEIRRGVGILESFPFVGTPRSRGKRRLNVGDYAVYYRVNKTKKIVTVSHIIRQCRNLGKFEGGWFGGGD